MKRVLIAIALLIGAGGVVVGNQPQIADCAPETTPAYAVLVLRKVAVESELGYLSGTVTSSHPSVKTKRLELQAV
jgi:hypothetical protein